MKRKTAFTLIEVLVVVAIIALLVGILLPSLASARTQARRVTCATQLHQVGVAMVAYMQDSRDRMPYVSDMPSLGLGPRPLYAPGKPIYFADVLAKQLKGGREVLRCPNDTPGLTDRGAPNTGRSFFQSERSSYKYRDSLNGLTPLDFNKMPHGRPGHEHQHPQDRHPAESIWFACDYWNFHGKEGQIGARRYVYIDGHVSDYEN